MRSWPVAEVPNCPGKGDGMFAVPVMIGLGFTASPVPVVWRTPFVAVVATVCHEPEIPR